MIMKSGLVVKRHFSFMTCTSELINAYYLADGHKQYI